MDKELKTICGDALEELKKIPDKSIRLITTDPPYNLNKNYGNNQIYIVYLYDFRTGIRAYF